MRCAPRLGPRGHQRRGGRDRRRPIVRQGGRCPTRAMLRSRVSQMSRDAGASVVTACPRVRTGTTEQAPTRRSVLTSLAAWAGVFPKPRRQERGGPSRRDRPRSRFTRVERRRARTAGDGGPWFFTRRASASRSVWSVSNLETDLVRRPRVRGTAPLATVGTERRLSSNSAADRTASVVSVSRRTKWTVSTTAPFTWLILPVVICLSQRLSHASVSTCRQMAKPRTAH